MSDAAWTIFDPNLRIDVYSDETMYTVTVTYLPTGMQVSCGDYPHLVQNRAAAIAKLKQQVTGS
jgi:protein subunit release factor A